MDANLIVASRGILNESVSAKFTGIGNFSPTRSTQKIFLWELLGPHAREWGSLRLAPMHFQLFMGCSIKISPNLFHVHCTSPGPLLIKPMDVLP